jgi:hypothetical protein
MVAGDDSGWIVSTTVSDSFFDIKWECHDGTAWHDDPLLTVTETTAADRAASAAEAARVLAITTIMVAGHTGLCASKMGTYKRNAEHSPTNGGNVYTKTDDSDVHFFRSNSGKWYFNNTTNMSNGSRSGVISSVTAKQSPLDLLWRFKTRKNRYTYPWTWVDDPFLKITGS